MKVMVWGVFWDNGRSNLYIMDRDFESLKYGYSANSYIEVLDTEVAYIFDSFTSEFNQGYQFIQDNASIYTVRKVKAWFASRGVIWLVDWPPYLPDLNPIEHIWWYLKYRVCEMFPELIDEVSGSENARQYIESCLQAAWDTLDKEVFDVLYKSIPERVAACIRAKG